MYMKELIIIMSMILPGNLVQGQVMGNYAQQQNTYQNINFSAQYRGVPKAASFVDGNVIEFNINALSNQKADSYTAIFTVYQAGKTAEETNQLLNERLEALLKDLEGLGFARDAIYVDMVNFLPKYEYDRSKKIFSKKTFTEIPKGFELQKNIHVRYSDPNLLERIVTAAARQEIYDIVKVDYFVAHPQAIYQELRTQAFEYLANIRAEYQKIGIRLDSAYVVTAENAWVAYPINRYESYQAFSTQSLDAAEKGSAVVETIDKPTLRFYNAVPGNDYDIVLNPEILEPAVQFSYNLAVRYTLPERKPLEKTQVQKEFILVTPDGEVKKLKIE